MKYRKKSFIGIATAVVIITAVGITFATSANVASADGNSAKKVETTTTDDTMLSAVDEDGKVRYSADGGRTFLEEEEFHKQYPTVDVEWWDYEEYKTWLENEKVLLQSMLGEKAYTNGRGNFVWTQEVIDETIAQYEETLQEIKDGLKISKTVDGSDDVALAQYDDNTVCETMETAATVTSNAANIPNQEYTAAGIERNSKNNAWYYNGKMIAGLYDQNGGIYTCDFKTKDDVTYLEILRDKQGKIKELRELTKEKWEKLL